MWYIPLLPIWVSLFCSYLWSSQLFPTLICTGLLLFPCWFHFPPSLLSGVASVPKSGPRRISMVHKKVSVALRCTNMKNICMHYICVSSNYRKVNTTVCVWWKGWGIEMSNEEKNWGTFFGQDREQSMCTEERFPGNYRTAHIFSQMFLIYDFEPS